MDAEATCEALNEALAKGLDEAVRVDAVIQETEPEITTEDLASIQDVLGTATTSFSSSGAARSTNVSVGASKINGRLLMPGEILSGYECLQPFTTANGYRGAASYANGTGGGQHRRRRVPGVYHLVQWRPWAQSWRSWNATIIP